MVSLRDPWIAFDNVILAMTQEEFDWWIGECKATGAASWTIELYKATHARSIHHVGKKSK